MFVMYQYKLCILFLVKMSANLQWQCIRKSSCFVLKKNGITFNTEPLNLASKNSFKFSGLVNRKAIGIDNGAERKGVMLITKKQTNARRYEVKKTALTKNRRKSFRSIRKTLGSNFYRKDLVECAVRHASAVWASQRPRNKKFLKRSGRK